MGKKRTGRSDKSGGTSSCDISIETKKKKQRVQKGQKGQQTIIDFVANNKMNSTDTVTLMEIKSLMGENTDKLLAEIQALRHELKGVKEECEFLKMEQISTKNEMKQIKEENNSLKSKLNNLEQWTRRSSIRIFGVKDTTKNESHEQSEAIVYDIFSRIGGQTRLKGVIDIAHRVGQFRTGEARPIIVKLFSRKDKIEIMRLKHQLKGSKIGIAEDLTSINARLYNLCRNDPTFTNVWTREGVIYARVKHNNNIKKIDPFSYSPSQNNHHQSHGRMQQRQRPADSNNKNNTVDNTVNTVNITHVNNTFDSMSDSPPQFSTPYEKRPNKVYSILQLEGREDA